MNALFVAVEVSTQGAPGTYAMYTITEDEDGKPLVVMVRACCGLAYARETARCSSLLYGGLACLAVYDENGHLDSAYESGKKIIIRTQ